MNASWVVVVANSWGWVNPVDVQLLACLVPVVVVANSWGWVNLHTAVAHRVVVTHTVEVVAAVRLVMVVAGSMVAVAVHRMTTVAGSGHCPSAIPPGLHAVLLPRVVPSIR